MDMFRHDYHPLSSNMNPLMAAHLPKCEIGVDFMRYIYTTQP